MLLFGLRDPSTIIIFAFVIILAFAYHEFAHAIVADRLGDPTPRQHGRITLNPFPHLSLAGLVMLFLIGFGGAYTPVSPGRLNQPWRRSHALVAIAGPIANLLMATLFVVPLHLHYQGIIPTLPEWSFNIGVRELNFGAFEIISWGVRLNIFLMVFNLVPIPPLDGFTILQGLLPTEMASQLDPLRQYGFMILMVALFFLPGAGIDIFGDLIWPAINTIETFLMSPTF